MKRSLSLYLHFPFCVRKCRYCDFLSFPSDDITREHYVQRLMEEIKTRSADYKDYEIMTIFIGGGTPSLMSGQQLAALMACVGQYFDLASDAEITMECNPGTVNFEKLRAYRQAGINRISFGLQSMHDEELVALGRIHTVSEFLENYAAAIKAGFVNINIDLMSALPGQNVSGWLDTLKRAIALKPKHISAYSLIIEEGTPFWEIYGNNGELDTKTVRGGMTFDTVAQTVAEPAEKKALPSEEDERKMYHETLALLSEAGYHRYEVSNYACEGYECRHNLTYWYRGDYLGLGLGAASMVQNRRFTNTTEMAVYMEKFESEQVQQLTKREQMEETMFLGMRCIQGISLSEFRQQFSCELIEVYGPVISRYEQMGMLKVDPAMDRLYLTEAGHDVSNWILSDFLLDE